MEKTINDLAIGEDAAVIKLNCTGSVRRRIIDMGLIPGVTVTLLRTAPLGDPLEIRIRGYEMSIRRSEAGRIYVVTND